MRLVLFQPDIPGNAGAMLRLAACLGARVDIIEPAGFPWSASRFRRAGMDYLDKVEVTRHDSFAAFESCRAARGGRLVLLTTAGGTPYTGFDFVPGDMLMVGRESCGVPAEVHAAADARLVIPMRPGVRSLNVAMAAAIVLAEAQRRIAEHRQAGEAIAS